MRKSESQESLSLASPSPVVQSTPGKIVLYSYWRSSCSWRVRIALHFKEIPFEYHPVNLLKDEQKSEDYLQLNPGASVPTLVIDNQILTQSLAILEYLEERRPESWRLLPQQQQKRAQVRAIMQMIASDIQPLQNLKVLKQFPDEKKSEWGKSVIESGFKAVEKYLEKTAGVYSVGDEVSLADVCLVPQVYNALRFNVDMSQFPLITRINDALSKLEAFQKAHPSQQPDAQPQ